MNAICQNTSNETDFRDHNILLHLINHLFSNGANQIYFREDAPKKKLSEDIGLDIVVACNDNSFFQYVSLIKSLGKIGDGMTPYQIGKDITALVRGIRPGECRNVECGNSAELGPVFEFTQPPYKIDVHFCRGDLDRCVLESQGLLRGTAYIGTANGGRTQ